MLGGSMGIGTRIARGVAVAAVVAGLGIGMAGCSINIGEGGSGDSATTQQPTGDSGTSGTQGTTGTDASGTGDVGSGDAGASAAGQGTTPSGSAGSAGTQATDAQLAGHWEIAAVWRGNEKLDLATEGMTGWYLDFYDEGYVVDYSGSVAVISDYVSSGNGGTIKGETSHYDEHFEVDSTTDGTGLAMKVNYVEITPDSFRVYKKVGAAPAIDTHPDLSQTALDRYFGSSGTGSASSSTGADSSSSSPMGAGSTSSGTSSSSYGSSTGTSSSSSDTPAPGTVVDGWEWV